MLALRRRQFARASTSTSRRAHISHELEDELNQLIDSTEARIGVASDSLASLHRFLLIAVGIFSGVSLLIALGLGAALSWSVIRPVRKMDLALARIADGDFAQRIDVPNRDEFGRLTTNLNRTSGQLATLYHDLEELKPNLGRRWRKLVQIRRAYSCSLLSPRSPSGPQRGAPVPNLHAPQPNILVATLRGSLDVGEH